MDIAETATVEQELLAQARRQTKALETIQSGFMLLLALVILSLLVGAAVLFAG